MKQIVKEYEHRPNKISTVYYDGTQKGAQDIIDYCKIPRGWSKDSKCKVKRVWYHGHYTDSNQLIINGCCIPPDSYIDFNVFNVYSAVDFESLYSAVHTFETTRYEFDFTPRYVTEPEIMLENLLVRLKTTGQRILTGSTWAEAKYKVNNEIVAIFSVFPNRIEIEIDSSLPSTIDIPAAVHNYLTDTLCTLDKFEKFVDD